MFYGVHESFCTHLISLCQRATCVCVNVFLSHLHTCSLCIIQLLCFCVSARAVGAFSGVRDFVFLLPWRDLTKNKDVAVVHETPFTGATAFHGRDKHKYSWEYKNTEDVGAAGG